MGSLNRGFNVVDEAQKQSKTTNTISSKSLKITMKEVVKTEVVDSYAAPSSTLQPTTPSSTMQPIAPLSTMQSITQTEIEKKRKAVAEQLWPPLEIPKQHSPGVGPQFGRLSEMSGLAPSSGNNLSSSVILPCGNRGDVEVVREKDGVLCLKDSSGKQVRLDPAVLFAGLGESDRSRLWTVFALRPDTFMQMGSLNSLVVRFNLETFSQMWGMLQNMKIGDCSEADLDDISKIFGDMQSINTDWIVHMLKRMRGLKKAKLERTDRLKAIDTEREQATAEIEKLKPLLSKAEEKHRKLLVEKVRIYCTPAEEDIALESSISQWFFGG